MTPYLNVRCDYFDHPKTKRLVGLLGRGAEVLPIRLWAYCGMFHTKDGKLTGYAEQEIEALVSWWGEKGRMMEALERVGYVVRAGDGWQMADWQEHQGHIEALKIRGRRMAEARWGRMRGSDDDCNADSIAEAMPKQCSIQPTNQPTHQQTLEEGGGGEISIARETGESRSESGRFALPRTGGLPSPLYAKTANQMVEQCKKEIMKIKREAKKTPIVQSIGGERVKMGDKYEPEAEQAVDAWRKRIEEIERAMA